ncbi:uncharacterized protein V6R79_017748 [Siganus canaliculatus]
MHSLLPFLCLFLIRTEKADASDHNLPFMEYLDPNNLVCLKWGFENLQGNITFKLVVNTTGWVGFGFSPNGGMKGSDIVMGGLGPSGNYFKDYHATGNSMPVVDKQQSYTLLSLSESDGQTTMLFQRSIQSCDDQDFHITTKPVKLIYAYGQTDEIKYHRGLRGTKEVNLLNYMPRAAIPNPKYFSITVNNFTVPPVKTYYHCKVLKFPSLATKHHIYLIEPEIENLDLVHHMLLYHCPPYVTQMYENPCFRNDIGDACFGVVATWAVGGGVFELPEVTGIPVGGNNTNRLYRLEIHYNNPKLVAGRKDNSGLRLYYTDQLRPYDTGILATGLQPFPYLPYDIPAKAKQFHSYGVCSTSSFSQLVSQPPDIQVFAVFLHTHLAGQKIRVAQYRDKQQIDFLSIEENYNFDYQQVVNLGNIKTLKMGDEIAVECTYSTANRTVPTKLGLSTTDEMCLAFLYYYPAIKITSCLSLPNTMSVRNSTYEPTLSQEEIAEYESLLKRIPQVEVVIDDGYDFIETDTGVVREMMKTPSVTCQNSNNAASKVHSPWIVSLTGIILMLLSIAVM